MGLGLGAAGAAVLAACGRTQVVDKMVTVDAEVEQAVERVVTKEVEQVVEKVATGRVGQIEKVPVEKKKESKVPTPRPSPRPLRWVDYVWFMADVSGPRGSALQWGMESFARWQPALKVRIQAASVDQDESLNTMFKAGYEPHLIIANESIFLRYRQDGFLTEVSHLLSKMGLVKEDYYFVPDSYTYNSADHSLPQTNLMDGPQFGMPFQMGVSGFVANASLAEDAGVRLPDHENSWTWDDWIEWDAIMTDPETGTFGTWTRDDYVGQYMPQMYSAGLKKPFDDGLTKTMFDQPQALRVWEYLIDKIYVHKTSPRPAQAEEFYKMHTNPFDAGFIGIWPSRRVSTVGYGLYRIREDFEWTLLPAVTAPGGGPAVHSWSDRAHLVTRAAALDHVEEAATVLAVFLAGETFQRRLGIERGHMPVHKAALGAPESLEPPPQGMKWLKYYADRPDNRNLFPFNTWRQWFDKHRELAKKGWTGEQTPAEALEACQAWGVEHLSRYEGPRPFVREPVYP